MIAENMNLFLVFLSAMIVNNILLIRFIALCSFFGISNSMQTSVGMGFAVIFVMIMATTISWLVYHYLLVPFDLVYLRTASFILTIATFVTIVDYSMKAYAPLLSRSLGVFVPLIVVNCIVMGRAEAFASRNGVAASLMDGIGMSIGFTFIITLIGVIRELFGNGTVFGLQVLPLSYQPFLIFILPPGAFLVIGFLMAAQKKFFQKGGK